MNGTLRPLSAISFAGSTACVVALHFVRPELDLASDRLSEYANGPYGWLMVAAFSTLGTGFGALGLALWREKRAWILRAAALTAAVASFSSGMFDTAGSSEPIHSYASTVAVLAATTLTLAYGLAPLRAASPTVDLTARCLSLGAAVMVVISPLVHGTSWTGLGQRSLWLLLVAALVLIALADAYSRRKIPRASGGTFAPEEVGDPTERDRKDERQHPEDQHAGYNLRFGAPGGNKRGGEA